MDNIENMETVEGIDRKYSSVHDKDILHIFYKSLLVFFAY